MEELTELVKEIPWMNRDISWLSFNYRVLQEAKDASVPLFERLKFYAIFSSNLDEFFRVRMANHRNLYRVGKKTKKYLQYSPEEIINEIQKTVDVLQEECSRIFEEELIPELRMNKIYLLRRLDLNPKQALFVEDYFQSYMLPYVQPVLLVKHKVRPFLNNAALYLVVALRDKHQPNASKEYAIVNIPSNALPRFVELPSKPNKKQLIMLDDIVRHNIAWMFPGYDILDAYSIKLTRDAELYIDDEFSGDLLSKIKQSLTKRHVGPASRFVYDREMPAETLNYLREVLELKDYDILREGRYHNNSDFFKFPNFGMDHLKNPPLPPLVYKKLEKVDDFWEAMRAQDHLLHVPYQSYESVVRFFEEAAVDPNVTHIKIVQYRVARKSRIMQALMKAVKKGKQVNVFIEVKARFDEEANLKWGEKLEKAGVQVNYSFPGLKVHSKLALVRRKEGDTYQLYAYMATGNFHEDTAKVYSDFGLFTTDRRLVNEVGRVFSFLETEKEPSMPIEHLLVGQFNMREEFVRLIDYEIAQAKAGKKAAMTLKMNSIEDRAMILKLYEASQAGVKIKLIIRGICCLVAGIEGISENIEVISIVDRFLEHARVFIFHHSGEDLIYLSSADWMTRNLSYRIETSFPIYDDKVKNKILELLNIQWCDNVKARVIDATQSNEYHYSSCSDMVVRTQVETYFHLKREGLEEEEED